MRHLSLAMVLCMVAVVLASARTVPAGVVMSETTAATTPEGLIDLQKKMIYLEGNKQKVERQDGAAITDLDNSVIYIIDKQHRVYAAVPLKALSSAVSGKPGGHSIKLDRTGKMRIIANHPCDEYRASEGNGLERVTISACVSTDAPGAREVSEFEQKMLGRITGRGLDRSSAPQAAALMLEKQSVLSFRIPDPARRRPYRVASLSAETRVNQIQLKPLPPETFRPPKGFHRLRNLPPEETVPASPGAQGQAIEVRAPARRLVEASRRGA